MKGRLLPVYVPWHDPQTAAESETDLLRSVRMAHLREGLLIMEENNFRRGNVPSQGEDLLRETVAQLEERCALLTPKRREPAHGSSNRKGPAGS